VVRYPAKAVDGTLFSITTPWRHSIVSLGTAALAGAAFAVFVVVTAFTAFAGAQYETAPEDHRNDEHSPRERDDNSGESEGRPPRPALAS
jgi:hypothetical protein